MKNMLSTLAFYCKYPGWNSFARSDKATQNAIFSLEKRGYLQINRETRQAKYTGKVWSNK